jgi:Ca2+/Na+ antiporter
MVTSEIKGVSLSMSMVLFVVVVLLIFIFAASRWLTAEIKKIQQQ